MSDSPLNAALNRNWIKASAEHERLERENAGLRSTNAALTTILDLCTEGTEITYGQVPDMIADLRSKLEEARKDAERYRWLRDVGDSTWQPLTERSRLAFPHVPTNELQPMIDEIIDAAIAQGKGEK